MQGILDYQPQIKIAVEASSKVGVPEDIVDSFEFIKRLGSGYHGTVYRTVMKHNNRTVAAKIIQKSEYENVPIISQLEHPYILPIIDLVISRLDPEFKMELYPLSSIIERTNENGVFEVGLTLENIQLPLSTLIELLKQLLEALRFINEKGFMHGDVKASNALIFNENMPQDIILNLGDFGRARKLSFLGRSNKKDFKDFMCTLIYCLDNCLIKNGIKTLTMVNLWPTSMILDATSLKEFIPQDILKRIIETYKGKDLNYRNILTILDMLSDPDFIEEP